jgi:hypothetical protein
MRNREELVHKPNPKQHVFNARYRKLSEQDIQNIISRRHYNGCLSEQSAELLPKPISATLRLGVESSNRCPVVLHPCISDEELTATLSQVDSHYCVSSESLSQMAWPAISQDDDWQLMNAAL